MSCFLCVLFMVFPQAAVLKMSLSKLSTADIKYYNINIVLDQESNLDFSLLVAEAQSYLTLQTDMCCKKCRNSKDLKIVYNYSVFTLNSSNFLFLIKRTFFNSLFLFRRKSYEICHFLLTSCSNCQATAPTQRGFARSAQVGFWSEDM
jgi:hypothetical protein